MALIPTATVASTQEMRPSLVGPATCGHLEKLGITGLQWGLCMDGELKQLTQAVERKQHALQRELDSAAGDALKSDWVRFLSELRTMVGVEWLGEYASGDVHGALLERLHFLGRIDTAPRSSLIGLWENRRTQLQITRDKSGAIRLQIKRDKSRDIRLQADESTSCPVVLGGQGTTKNGVTLLQDEAEIPIETFLSGNALRLSLDLDSFGKRHSCDASRVVGYYLPVTSAGQMTVP